MTMEKITNPSIKLLFCHGWGFDPGFFTPLKKLYAKHEMVFWDLGYFGTPSIVIPPHMEKECWIGIGHSLGFFKLIDSDLPFKALVGLQGFVNFLGNRPALRKERSKQFDRLQKNLFLDPIQTMAAFYARCGVDMHKKNHNLTRLQEDLDLIGTSCYDPSLLKIPYRILGSLNDPIVTPSLLYDNFGTDLILLHERGLHGLGHLEASFIYNHV